MIARYLTNSASSSRVVVCRSLPERPRMPSPELPEDSDRVISGPLVSVFAASASVRAGTSTAAVRPGVSGRQANSRTASR
jgi:hypothetical protein